MYGRSEKKKEVRDPRFNNESGKFNEGLFNKSYDFMKDMQKDTKLKPDEIMYNSLLDGCAQNNLFEEGQDLLKQMLQAGIVPSNFRLEFGCQIKQFLCPLIFFLFVSFRILFVLLVCVCYILLIFLFFSSPCCYCYCFVGNNLTISIHFCHILRFSY